MTLDLMDVAAREIACKNSGLCLGRKTNLFEKESRV